MKTRELLILRHGKSDWQQAVPDFERPMKKRGKRGAQRIGAWLKQQVLIPDVTISSPAVRARTTAEHACMAMGQTPDAIRIDERIYEASLRSLLNVLADCPDGAHRVMLVGHNPGLETLLLYLGENKVGIPEDGKLLPTATLAHLRVPKGWKTLSAGCAEVLSVVRADSLSD